MVLPNGFQGLHDIGTVINIEEFEATISLIFLVEKKQKQKHNYSKEYTASHNFQFSYLNIYLYDNANGESWK